MQDFIEEYFSYIIGVMLILSIWIIFTYSWGDHGDNKEIVSGIPSNTTIEEKVVYQAPFLVERNMILDAFLQEKDELDISPDHLDIHENSHTFTVIRVIDWDTIDIWLDANVRILGIDAPESSTIRYGHTECNGELSSIYTEKALLWKEIVVEKDTIQPEKDRYKRYLLHVWLNNELFSENIIKDWYAKQYTKVKNTYSDRLSSAETIAKIENKWLWWNCK